jgi:ATP-dependent Clp protease ATP-binding subunit ClpA
VAGGSNNLYQRLQIDDRRLEEYLLRHPEDAISAPATPASTGAEITDIGGYLSGRVINQPTAVERATRALRRMRSGLGAPGQVIGKFLFLGPSGVGKTELARAMGDVAFGVKPGVRDPYLISIDCGNFVNEWDVVQLLGAAQGLKGYKEGQLTNGLREKPKAVILFDEAEKAHERIWQSLLPLFEGGFVREADGTLYDATQCILVLTSNKGYKEAAERFDVWDRPWEQVREPVEQFVQDAMRQYFSPEFLGRIGAQNIIFFNHFSREDYRRIAALQLARVVEEMRARGIDLVVDEAAAGLFAELVWPRRIEGARPLLRMSDDMIRDRMVAARETDPARTKFHFTVRGDDLVLEDV